jgi:hypothetical protein
MSVDRLAVLPIWKHLFRNISKALNEQNAVAFKDRIPNRLSRIAIGKDVGEHGQLSEVVRRDMLIHVVDRRY